MPHLYFEKRTRSTSLLKYLKLFVYTETIFFLFKRKLNENQELVSILDSCLVSVAHNKSPFVPQILQHVGEDTSDPLTGTHLLVLQKVGLTKRQVVAVWLSGIQYSWCIFCTWLKTPPTLSGCFC